MEHHPNAKLATESWLAVSNSDIDALEKLWSDDIVWHLTGDSPWAGVYAGRAAVLEFLAEVGEGVEDYDARLEDVLVSDHRLLFVCHLRVKYAGHDVLEVDQLVLARIASGKVAEVWMLSLDPEASRAYWNKVREGR